MKRPIRVLQIMGTMQQGGSQNFIMNMYRNVDRSKIQFDFVMHGEENIFEEEIKKLGGNIFKLKYINKIGGIRYKKQYKKFFREHYYDIIHIHLNKVSGIVAEAAKEENIKVIIVHSHNIGNSNNFIYKIYKNFLGKKILKNATNFLACSDMAAKWLFKEKSKEAIIIKNAIEINKFLYSEEKRRNIRDELNIKEDCTVIGNIARFTKQKNHTFLIDIFYEYQKKNPNSCLILVGKGELEKKIKDKVNKLGICNKVKFLENRIDTDYLYCAFDYFVLPSLYEGLGIVLIEAQTNGLLCFTSNNVPEEVKITNNIEFISLKKDNKYWANYIYDKYKKSQDRKIQIESIKTSGYDIQEASKKLENFYISCYKYIK